MKNILGISIGTHNVGLAVIKDGDLVDYRIRTFAGRWTPEKREDIFDVVEFIIKKDKIEAVSIKMPPRKHCSENIRELASGIKGIAEWYGLKTLTLNINDLKTHYGQQERCSKKTFISAVSQKYPKLTTPSSESKKSAAYCAKLYEAIACADHALKAGH